MFARLLMLMLLLFGANEVGLMEQQKFTLDLHQQQNSAAAKLSTSPADSYKSGATRIGALVAPIITVNCSRRRRRRRKQQLNKCATP